MTAAKEENPLVNILINVLLPTVILSKLSKEGDALYQLGPTWAMVAALALPLGYGIWHWLKHRTLNIFSAVGMGAILLTGLITIYLWYNENAKPHVAWIFGIKEAVQPLILGSLFLITRRSTSPLFRTFIYNDAIFDIKRIEKTVAEKNAISEYDGLIWKCTLYFFGSFCLSAVLNLGLAHYFLGDLSPNIENWKEEYNGIVGSITLWGFLAIGVPMMVVACYILYMMINGLEKLTGLDKEALLLPR
ncbi:VC0807 family protein [Rubritalea tangerina]|uniref:VC0807 family protein n=1 Tax=Rubritalea tangerina TaxID=430798 RepID=A0ABW4ZEW7_9BACT